MRIGWIALPLAVMVVGVSTTAHAQGGWETVMQDRDREVQVDRGSVMRSDRGTRVAWARVVLSPSEAAAAGHVVVQALNRYDCVNRSITTLRRRYLDARNIIVREESVGDPRAVSVTANSVDERLWREVCQPGGMAELERIAAEATRLIAEMGGEAVVRETPAPRPPGVPSAERAPVVDAVPVPTQTTPASPARAVPVESQPAADPVQASHRARVVAPVVDSRTWSYHGENGPANWGKMDPEWAVCQRGARQSPVDVRNGIGLDLEPVHFDYRETRFRVSDTGRALEVHVGDGLTTDIRGQRFVLTRMRFHSPSEIRVEGRVAPLAVHFLHQDEAGMQAVVVVALEGGGSAHPVLQEILNAMPIDRGAWHMPGTAIKPAGLVPDDPGYFLFLGSLSTPPCTEGVTWVVMKSPVAVSNEQIAILRRLHPDNVRPVQALNDRLILESR